MALCTRCGHPTEPEAEFCIACGGYAHDASSVGAYAASASRVTYSPGSGSDEPSQPPYSPAWADDRDGIDPLWHQEPGPGQFRFQQPATGSVPGQYAPEPTAADRDRQFRYEQTASGTGALPQFDRHYPGEPASPAFAPAGLMPDFGSRPAAPVADWPVVPPSAASADGFAGPAEPLVPAGSAPSMPAAYVPITPGRSGRSDPDSSQRGRAIRDLSRAPRGAGGGMHNGRWIAMAATTAVLLIAAAVAVVLVRHHGTAGHTPRAAAASTTARPSSSATAGVSQPTVNGLVTVVPSAATAPHEAAVVAVLNRYFRAINSHAYGAYEKLFSPALRSGLSAAAFSSGFGTTTDSAETLHSIAVIGAGQVDAVVTFTSHQQAADSPTQSSCTAWRISLYLVKERHRYLLEAPPQGYQASYRSCS
jgi:hypothetical protein